jgi:dTDP-4-amino-4,6-dideoxygalactose transaminase
VATVLGVQRLAVAGGTPVRDVKARPWPQWPDGTDEDVAAVGEVIRSGHWNRWNGDRVTTLEAALQTYTGARRAVAVSSGTAALEVALKAVGIRPGDEVIVPAYTFAASATAVLQVGAIPIFADVLAETANLDPTGIEPLITERTRAVIPVHKGGLPCDMEGILTVTRRHGLRVVEDAAQAIGGAWNGRRAGTMGDVGCYSFQASKTLPCGEGGALVTNDDVVADKAYARMHIGRKPGGAFYTHYVLGWNYRLTEIQAALLLSQFQRFPDLQARRRENAAVLRDGLASIPGIHPQREDPFVTEHGLYTYVCRFVSDEFAPNLGISRAVFLKALHAEGILATAGYDLPLHKNPLFLEAHEVMKDDCPFACDHPAARHVDYTRVHLPVAERLCAEEAVWFPQRVLLAERADVQQIVDAAAKVQAGAAQLA